MKIENLALVAALFAGPAMAADVGVSINVNQPGLYGQINIGNVPQPPQVIYTQPVYVQRPPDVRGIEPVYLHVPPGHEKHWERHCREYNACGKPVYFVREDWYSNHYRGHEDHGDHDDHGEHHDNGRGHDHERGREHGHD
ncbi:MAG TPA: hypothetical protein VIF60_15575 [Burkholderiaceae bacterium]|jgi:hypothetical protein